MKQQSEPRCQRCAAGRRGAPAANGQMRGHGDVTTERRAVKAERGGGGRDKSGKKGDAGESEGAWVDRQSAAADDSSLSDFSRDQACSTMLLVSNVAAGVRRGTPEPFCASVRSSRCCTLCNAHRDKQSEHAVKQGAHRQRAAQHCNAARRRPRSARPERTQRPYTAACSLCIRQRRSCESSRSYLNHYRPPRFPLTRSRRLAAHRRG